MTSDSISEWLTAIGLEQYIDAFTRNDIDFDLLAQVDDQLLKDIGITSAGHRLRIRNEIQKRLGAIAAPSLTPTSAHSDSDIPTGERRQLTVMFCDLMGSTELSSRLDPEEFRELVRAYQSTCTQEIQRFEGHVAQYLGDGLLVYFGHPHAHEDDASRALRTGLNILSALSDLNKRLSTSLSVRIGVHTGLVVLGKVGAGERQETLALGEVPNVAARLQSMAAPDTLVISEATQRLAEGLFDLQPLGAQVMKGIADPMPAYRVTAPSAVQDRIDVRGRLSALVGRDQELGLLTDRWERAAEGQGQVVLLVGEPGIGKSRIVRALDEALAQHPHHRAELRCSPLYSHTPLYPFVERLPQRLGWEAGDNHETEMAKLEATLRRFGVALEESLPLLANLLSRTPPARYPLPPMTPQRERRRTLETLVSLIGGMAMDRPVLLVVEDLHWADPSTLELISQHIEQAPTMRMLLLLTARPGFQSPWGARSYLTPLLLNRLTLKQTQAFVGQLTRGKTLPDDVLRPIVQKTDGVPLFVEELTKSVLEAKWLIDKGDHYELDGPLPELAIPATLQDSLMSRLDRLPKGRDVAQLAAALGRNFSFELISAVAGRDPVSLTAELDALVNAELLFQKGFGAEATYMFKHALLQDAAYQSLLKSTRQQIHRTVVNILVTRFPDEALQRPESVAHHYFEAGMLLESARYLKLAGEVSLQRSAFAEAIAHYRSGIERLSTLPATTERFQLELVSQLGLGSAIVPLQGYSAPEAERIYLRASEIAEQIDDKPRLVEALWGLGLGYWVGHSVEAGYDVGQRALHIAQSAQDLESVLAARHCIGCAAMAKGDSAEAKHHFGAFLAEYGDHPRPALNARYSTDLKLNTMHFFAPTLWMLGYADQAMRLYQDVARECAESPNPYNRIWGSVCLGQLAIGLRDASRFEERFKADIALCEEQDLMFMHAVVSMQYGGFLCHGRDVELGIQHLVQGLRAYENFGAEFSTPLFYVQLAAAYLSVGDHSQGLSAAADGLAISEKNGERRHDAELHRVRGELLLRSTDNEQAGAIEFMQALEISRAQQAKSLELRAACSLARLWKSQGEKEAARELLAPVYSWFTEGFDTRDLQEARALLQALDR